MENLGQILIDFRKWNKILDQDSISVDEDSWILNHYPIDNKNHLINKELVISGPVCWYR